MNGQQLADVLDQTVHALGALDLDALNAIEERLVVLSRFTFLADEAGIASILLKKRVLQLVLNHSESALKALQNLYGRNTRDLWEH